MAQGSIKALGVGVSSPHSTGVADYVDSILKHDAGQELFDGALKSCAQSDSRGCRSAASPRRRGGSILQNHPDRSQDLKTSTFEQQQKDFRSGVAGSGLNQQIVRDPSQRLSAKAARRTPRVAPSCAPINPPVQPQGSPTQSPTRATASAMTKKANSKGSPPSFPGIRKYTAPSNNRLGYRRTLSLYFIFVIKRDRCAWASSALGTLLITLP